MPRSSPAARRAATRWPLISIIAIPGAPRLAALASRRCSQWLRRRIERRWCAAARRACSTHRHARLVRRVFPRAHSTRISDTQWLRTGRREALAPPTSGPIYSCTPARTSPAVRWSRCCEAAQRLSATSPRAPVRVTLTARCPPPSWSDSRRQPRTFRRSAAAHSVHRPVRRTAARPPAVAVVGHHMHFRAVQDI